MFAMVYLLPGTPTQKEHMKSDVLTCVYFSHERLDACWVLYTKIFRAARILSIHVFLPDAFMYYIYPFLLNTESNCREVNKLAAYEL